MKYTFKKMIPRYTRGDVNRLVLNKTNLSIGWEAYEIINKPERLDIFFDKENKAIRLVASTHGKKVSNPGYNSRIMGTNLSNIMPMGIYRLDSETKDVYVWKEKNPYKYRPELKQLAKLNDPSGPKEVEK